MKKLIIALLSIGLLPVTAQNVKVSSTEERESKHTDRVWDRILGEDESGYYLLREIGPVTNKEILLEKIDKSLKEVSSKNIQSSSGVMGDSKNHVGTEMANGRLFVFLSGWNKSSKEGSFYVKELSLDGAPMGGDHLLVSAPAKNMLKTATHEYSLSADASKLLVATKPMFVKGSSETISLDLFDTKSFEKIWSHEVDFQVEAKRYPIHELAVDNAGNAYLYKEMKVSNKVRDYQMVAANADGVKRVPLDLKGNYPTYKKMFINNDGDLCLVAMLTALGSHISTWQNNLFLKVGAGGKVITNTVEPLGADLLSLIVSEKQAQKAGFKLPDYQLKDVLQKPEGGYLLLAEKLKKTKEVVGESTPPKYLHTLTYGGIVVLSFTNDGTRDWNVYYDKKQVVKTQNTAMELGSFAYGIVNGKLNLIWNFTEFDITLAHNFRHWYDANGSRINIDNIYGEEAFYPTLLTSINMDGTFNYTNRTFYALPLADIQKPNSFKMAVDPSVFFVTDNGIHILSRMNGEESKRHKFNTILIE